MKVSNVNGVNPNQVNAKDVKTAAKVATVAGGAKLVSKVTSDVFSHKSILKLAEKDPVVIKDLFSKKPEEFLSIAKNMIEGTFPKPLSGLLNKTVEATPKNIKKYESALKEISANISSGKIDYKPILKRGLKGAGIAAVVAGAIAFAGVVISKAINASKTPADGSTVA